MCNATEHIIAVQDYNKLQTLADSVATNTPCLGIAEAGFFTSELSFLSYSI